MAKISFFIEIGFYLLVAYLPFQLALNLAPDIDLLSGRLFILGLFGFWLLTNLFGQKPSWSKNLSGFSLSLFFLIASVSLLIAENQFWAGRKLFLFFSVFPLYFLTSNLINNQEKIKKLIWVIAGGAALSALIALGQFLAQFVFGLRTMVDFWGEKIAPYFLGRSFSQLVAANPSWLVETGGHSLMRAIGLFPDPHMLAFYLGLILPIVLVSAIFNKSKKFKFILFLIFCFLSLVLALTFSRGAYLGVLISLAVVLLLGWRYLAAPDKKFLARFLLLVGVFLIIFGSPIMGRFISSFDLSEGSNLGRLAIWQSALKIWQEQPILGVGLGNYPLAIDFSENYRNPMTSHNLYLDILVELGIFGLLAWLVIFFGAFKNLAGRIKDNFLAIGLIGSLVYFCVHSFFETAIFNPTILAFLMIILGVIRPITTKNRRVAQ